MHIKYTLKYTHFLLSKTGMVSKQENTTEKIWKKKNRQCWQDSKQDSVKETSRWCANALLCWTIQPSYQFLPLASSELPKWTIHSSTVFAWQPPHSSSHHLTNAMDVACQNLSFLNVQSPFTNLPLRPNNTLHHSNAMAGEYWSTTIQWSLVSPHFWILTPQPMAAMSMTTLQLCNQYTNTHTYDKCSFLWLWLNSISCYIIIMKSIG